LSLFLGGLFFSLSVNVAQCQNSCTGEIIELPAGTHTITNTLTIPSNDLLLIHPGANIEFTNPDAKLVILGCIEAIGTETQPITFFTNQSDGWGGIDLTGNNSAQFAYCDFSGIDRGIDVTGLNTSENNGGIIISQRKNVVFDHCNFSNNKGGIHVEVDAQVFIENCDFDSNEMEGDFYGLIYFYSCPDTSIIKKSTFKNNKTNLDGIVSINDGVNIIIQENTFTNTNFFPSENSKADRGYPIIFSKTNTYKNFIVINNNIFQGNLDFSGQSLEYKEISLIGNNFNVDLITVMLWKNTFYGNLFPFYPTNKTAIRATGSTLTITQCKFKYYNNNAIFLNYSYADVINCLFDANSVKSAIFMNYYSSYSGNKVHVKIDNCVFQKNKATKGGAIQSLILENDKVELIIKESIFFDNSAKGINSMGGVVYAENLGNAKIINNTFQQNSSDYVGGAVYLHQPGSNIKIADNMFLQNFADNIGGALYLDGNGSFSTGQVEIASNEFVNNIAVNKGGAVYLNNQRVKFEANSIESNEAEFGGGMYVEILNESEISENLFRNNYSVTGSGLYLKDNYRGNLFSVPNSGFNFNLYRNVFTENTYEEKGGGCYIENCDNVSFYQSLFSYNNNPNTESGSGGGIYVRDSNLGFYNCMFLRNDAESMKGSLCFNINQFYSLTFHNCNVVNNLQEGGMLFPNTVNPSVIAVFNSLFYGLGLRSIMYDYPNNPDPITTNNCYFREKPAPFNIAYVNELVSVNPGWEDNDIYRLAHYSVCIDKGDDGDDFNDTNFPPSWQLVTNDIGITGGPHASMENPCHEPTIYNRIEPFFDVDVICEDLNLVKITENSLIKDNNASNLQYRWYFGDGKSTKPGLYSKNMEQVYAYDHSIDDVTILLVISSDGINYYYQRKVRVNAEQDKQQDRIIKHSDETFKTKVSNHNFDDLITIYPNPSNGVFTISIDDTPDQIFEIRIFNLLGNNVFLTSSGGTNQILVDISDKPRGVYLIEIVEGGKIIGLKKIFIN
jgi:hypothetical protein